MQLRGEVVLWYAAQLYAKRPVPHVEPMVPLSILDLAPIVRGGDATRALRASLALAQHTERLGYQRFWMAEHHSMPGIASAATAVALAHVAAGTSTIRIGAGGVMLPNHSPLVIAEQYGTLAALHPGRVDLGLGRAPGGDQATARALRRDPIAAADAFPRDVAELLGYFGGERGRVRAIPGEGLDVPVWILGSSLFGAQLAAKLGLPYAFASHFSPRLVDEAVATYRRGFEPSARLQAPRVMLAANVFAADDAEVANWLASSLVQAFVALRRGAPRPLPPPVDRLELGPGEEALLAGVLQFTVVGTGDAVAARLDEIATRHGADEMILTSQIYDPVARHHSFELIARAAGLPN